MLEKTLGQIRPRAVGERFKIFIVCSEGMCSFHRQLILRESHGSLQVIIATCHGKLQVWEAGFQMQWSFFKRGISTKHFIFTHGPPSPFPSSFILCSSLPVTAPSSLCPTGGDCTLAPICLQGCSLHTVGGPS